MDLVFAYVWGLNQVCSVGLELARCHKINRVLESAVLQKSESFICKMFKCKTWAQTPPCRYTASLMSFNRDWKTVSLTVLKSITKHKHTDHISDSIAQHWARVKRSAWNRGWLVITLCFWFHAFSNVSSSVNTLFVWDSLVQKAAFQTDGRLQAFLSQSEVSEGWERKSSLLFPFIPTSSN